MPVIQKPRDTLRDTPRDAIWQPAPCASGRYHPWLTDHGSLTRRIEARSPGMKVKVVFQGRRRLHRDERFMAAGNALALTRDVLLYCGDTLMVYAHSVLRPSERGAGFRLMKGMGARPLGAALFTDPRIRRLMLRQHKLGRGHELYRQVSRIVKPNRTPVTFWARRSLFMIGKSPILVTEVFLPGVLAL
jgi:chorismate lyase